MIFAPADDARDHSQRGALCPAPGAVVLFLSQPDDFLGTHHGITLAAIADTIARLKHYRFAGRWDESQRYSGHVFFVPDETLLALLGE